MHNVCKISSHRVPLRPADLLPVDEADLVGPKFLLRPKLSRELVIGKARDALLFHLGEESQILCKLTFCCHFVWSKIGLYLNRRPLRPTRGQPALGGDHPQEALHPVARLIAGGNFGSSLRIESTLPKSKLLSPSIPRPRRSAGRPEFYFL